ncbi:N-acetylglucosamine-1-phosphotransferase subunits alpha/beta [Musca vetustissima]|uniref:N-acetylglucosamine-1-phosphotransferase subunits alpha/beta n=1 Tax=Musca vetustissima TaxID=27455 RepID=UPI002AB68069|nr:N-acetylglucosamine-1-phosphotransferase subunits alpha/beta [Musca vetustissima]
MCLRRTSKYVAWTLKKRLWKILLASMLIIVLFWFKHKKNGKRASTSSACEPMDVVYTWVNGSDSHFYQTITQYREHYDKNRFDDKNELKYSLRSLEKYAPWIRHIYIVTNGQIPGWLDLSNERITIVPHKLLIPNEQWLPLFSSAAIETFIHRIPNLSNRFLYLNDDIFLGSELYPEDLYTHSEGTRVFQAWLVPECSQNCPWTYIGDKICDYHCNVSECQYDGGDCVNDVKYKTGIGFLEALTQNQRSQKQSENKRNFRNRKGKIVSTRSTKHFADILNGSNLTHPINVKALVDTFNKHHQSINAPILHTTAKHFRSPLNTSDNFSQSLIYTNMLLNRRYGFKARHVISHVGFLLDKQIIGAMQKKFAHEIYITATHRFRAPDDLQFAFLYYSFLMEETFTETIESIFGEFDTDNSLTWSDREIRTLLAKMFPLPLDWSAVRFFEEVIQNCSQSNGYGSAALNKNQHTTVLYERYEDSHLPTVTKDLVKKCLPLVEALTLNFAQKPMYKYKINSKRNVLNNFMMLTSNVTDVVDALDRIRRDPRKFNCINDNLNSKYPEENELIRHLLEDFYLSFFPHRSKFELDHQYRNRFENYTDYVNWRLKMQIFWIVIYGVCVIFMIFIVQSICRKKRQILFIKYCHITK